MANSLERAMAERQSTSSMMFANPTGKNQYTKGGGKVSAGISLKSTDKIGAVAPDVLGAPKASLTPIGKSGQGLMRSGMSEKQVDAMRASALKGGFKLTHNEPGRRMPDGSTRRDHSVYKHPSGFTLTTSGMNRTPGISALDNRKRAGLGDYDHHAAALWRPGGLKY